MSKKKSDPLANLDARRRKYVEKRVEGKSKKEAALEAGFSESMAASAVAKIENEDVRVAFRKLVQQAIPATKIVEKLTDGMDAYRSYVDKEGESHFETDFRERREYLKLAANYGGYYVDKSELDITDKTDPAQRLAELLARAASRTGKAPEPTGAK